MNATAHRMEGNANAPVLYMAPELSNTTWKVVFGEAGDAVAARDVVAPEDVHELSALVASKAPARTSDEQITLFKSVGTGVQDIALAAAIHESVYKRGLGTRFDDFPVVKKT